MNRPRGPLIWAAMSLPKALVILCSEYLQITEENDLSYKVILFLSLSKQKESSFRKCHSGFFSAQMGIEWIHFNLYGMADFLIDSLKIAVNLGIILYW